MATLTIDLEDVTGSPAAKKVYARLVDASGNPVAGYVGDTRVVVKDASAVPDTNGRVVLNLIPTAQIATAGNVATGYRISAGTWSAIIVKGAGAENIVDCIPGTGAGPIIGGSASSTSYTPATGANWTDPDPTTVAGALDVLAAGAGSASSALATEISARIAADNAHAALTGSAAHGLGTASTHAAEDFDAAGAGTSAANSAVTAHVGATDPHGDRAYTTSQINALIAAAPGALDTLNELAAALGDDPNFATTMTNALALKQTLANLDTNTALGTSDTKYPSQKAAKAYADAVVAPMTAPSTTVDQYEWRGHNGAGTFDQPLVLNPKLPPYNAKFDVRTFATGAMTSGSNVLTVTGYTFSAADIGKLCKVVGAGAAGAALKTTITGVSAGNALLAANASTTVSGTAGTAPYAAGNVVFGTDDTTAIQQCLTDAAAFSSTSASNGARAVRMVHMPQGVAMITQLVMPRRFHLQGAGWGNYSTIFGFGFEQANNTLLYQKWDVNDDAIIFTDSANGVLYAGPGVLKDLQLVQDLDNTAGNGINFRDAAGNLLPWTDGTLLSNIGVYGFAKSGFKIGNGTVPGHLADCRGFACGEYGLDFTFSGSGSITSIDNFSCDQNGLGGMVVRGAGSTSTIGVLNIRSLKSECTTNIYRVGAGRQEHAIVFDRAGGALVTIDGLDHIAGSPGETTAPAGALHITNAAQGPVIMWKAIHVRVAAGQTGTPYLLFDESVSPNITIPTTMMQGMHTTGGALGRQIMNTAGGNLRFAITNKGDWFGSQSENPGIQIAGTQPTLSLASLSAGTNQVITTLMADSAGHVRLRTYTSAGAADEDVIDLRRSTTAGDSQLVLGSSSAAAKLGFFGIGTAVTKQTVSGGRGGQAALRSLLAALAAYGLVTDSSTTDGGTLITTGEESMDRRVAVGSATMSSGFLRICYFEARKTETITQIRSYTGGTAAGATPTLCRKVIFSVDANGGLTAVLASTTNDTTLWAAANTGYTRSLSSSWSKVAGTRYAAAALCVTAATAPALVGSSHGAAIAGVAPRIAGLVQGQSDIPSSVASGSVGDSGAVPYFEFLP